MAAYEVLLLNTAVPQIQAAQSGDTYVVPRDIAFSAALTLSAGTANGVPYLNGSKVLTSGSALTFDGTNLGVGDTTPSNYGAKLVVKTATNANFAVRSIVDTGGSSIGPAIDALNDNAGGVVPLGFRATQYEWRFASTEAMRLDSTGLGIGTSSPGYKLDVFGSVRLKTGATGTPVIISTGGDSQGTLRFGSASSEYSINGGADYLALIFNTNGTERARITSDGYLKASNDGVYVNSTGTFHEFSGDGTTETLLVDNTISSSAAAIVHTRGAANFAGKHYIAENLGTSVFEVAANGNVTNTNGSYGTISDAKMKTDIVDAGSQWSDIKALRFRKFKMKDDPSGLVQLGVVAQEVEQTSPGLVDEQADKDAEGNDLGTTTKSVKTSILLMKAAVALQEAMARIEKLEAEVAALKGN